MIETKITIVGTPREAWLMRRKKMPAALMRASTAAARGLSAYTHERYLNFPSSGPPEPHGLRHQTGRLGRATNATALGRPQDLGGTVFKSTWGVMDPNVPYAYKHEYGGTYQEMIPAHSRRIRSRDVREGRRIIAQGIAFVGESRPFTRTYQPRRMFRTASADRGRMVVELAGKSALGPLLENGTLVDGQKIRSDIVAAGVPARDPR